MLETTKYIALLRGINVSGQKKIKMVDLREMIGQLGFDKVKTYIQSGNILFEAADPDPASVAEKIGTAIAKTFGFDVSVLVKTRKDIEGIIDQNPFQNPEDLQANRIYYVLLKDTPEPALVQAFRLETYPNEKFFISEECVYLCCLKGYGQAKLNNNLLERKLKIGATTRNHGTMMKLLEMSSSQQ